MKIIDKIQECIADERVFYSFEYFPPKTDAGEENLYSRLDRMSELGPLFCDITWGAGGSTSSRTLAISKNVQHYSGLNVLMHVTCTNVSLPELEQALDLAQAGGIQNILALRGDPPAFSACPTIDSVDSDSKSVHTLEHAIDLVTFVKHKFGDTFSIAVAGYPEMHPESDSRESDLAYLKAKVDAGADFVISQLFFDPALFLSFVTKCRAVGIQCPILPGIMPIQNYRSFCRMVEFTNTYVPADLWEQLNAVKDDDEAGRCLFDRCIDRLLILKSIFTCDSQRSRNQDCH